MPLPVAAVVGLGIASIVGGVASTAIQASAQKKQSEEFNKLWSRQSAENSKNMGMWQGIAMNSTYGGQAPPGAYPFG